jgi:hypothetical protein
MALTTFGQHQLISRAYDGMDIIPSELAVRKTEDWSDVRSPSRARRRLKQGHRQNIKTVDEPIAIRSGNAIFMHPKLYDELRRATVPKMQKAPTDQA